MTMETAAAPATGTADEHDIAQEKIINEEYKVWKKNSPFLYEYVLLVLL
jgi:histone-binding protein RBBP4